MQVITEHFEFNVDHTYNTLRWYKRDEYSARNKIFNEMLKTTPSEIPNKLLVQSNGEIGITVPEKRAYALIAQAMNDSNHAPSVILQGEFRKKLDNDMRRYQIKAAKRIQSSLTDLKNGKINRIEARSQFDSARLSMKHMGVQAIKTRTQQLTQSSVVESAMEEGVEELIFRTKPYKSCPKCKVLNGKHFRTEDVNPLKPNIQNALGVPDKDLFMHKPKPKPKPKPKREVEVEPIKEVGPTPIIDIPDLRKVTTIPKEYNELSNDDQIVLEPYFAIFPDSIIDKKKLVKLTGIRPEDKLIESTLEDNLIKCIKKDVLKKTGLSQSNIKQLLLTPETMLENHHDIYMKFKDSTGIDPTEFQKTVVKTYQKDMPTEGYRFVHYGNVNFRKSLGAPNAVPGLTSMDDQDVRDGLANGVYFRAAPNSRDAFEPGTGFQFRAVALELDPKWVKENRLAFMHDYDKGIISDRATYNGSNYPAGAISAKSLSRCLENYQNETYILDNIPLNALRQVTINPNGKPSEYKVKTEKEKEVSIKKLKKHYEDMGVQVVISKKLTKSELDEWIDKELVVIDDEVSAAEYTVRGERTKVKAVLPGIFEKKPEPEADLLEKLLKKEAEIAEKKKIKVVSKKAKVIDISMPDSISVLDDKTRDYAMPYIATIPDSIVDKKAMVKKLKKLQNTAPLDSICEKAIIAGIRDDITRKTGLDRTDIARILISSEGAGNDFGGEWISKSITLNRVVDEPVSAYKNKAIKIIQKDMPTESYTLVHYTDNVFGFTNCSPMNVKTGAKYNDDMETYGLNNGVLTRAVSNKDNVADLDRNFGKRGIIVEIDPKWVKDNRMVSFHPKAPGESIVKAYNEDARTGSKITKDEINKILKSKSNIVNIMDSVSARGIKKVTIDPDAAIWGKMIGQEYGFGDKKKITSRKDAIETVRLKCEHRDIEFEVLKKGAVSSPLKDKKLAEAMGEVRLSIKKPKTADKDSLSDKYPSLDKTSVDIIDNVETRISKQYTKTRANSKKDIVEYKEAYVKNPYELLKERDPILASAYKNKQQKLINEWQSKSDISAKKKLFDNYRKLDETALTTVAYSRACFKKAHPKGTTVYVISTVSPFDETPVGRSVRAGVSPLTSVVESEYAVLLKAANLKEKGMKITVMKTTIKENDVYWDSRFGGNKESIKNGEIMLFPCIKDMIRVL